MAAGGTIFDDQVWQPFADEFKETVGAFDLLPQAFALGIGMIAAEAGGLVVIDLEVAEAALL